MEAKTLHVGTRRIAINWNGKRLDKDWFTPSKGIRQGDSISPYLFVLCIERLGHLIHHAIKSDNWKSILLSRNDPYLSHIFFSADDLIIFAEASRHQIKTIMGYDLQLFFVGSQHA